MDDQRNACPRKLDEAQEEGRTLGAKHGGGRRQEVGEDYGFHWEFSSLQTQLPQILLPGHGSCTGDLQSQTVWFYDGKWPQELGQVTAQKRIPTRP